MNNRMYNSKTWGIVKGVLSLALFSYLLVDSLGELPERRAFINTIFWSTGIVFSLFFLVRAFRMKSAEVSDETVRWMKGKIRKRLKWGAVTALLMIVVLPLILHWTGKGLTWCDFIILAVSLIVFVPLVSVLGVLGNGYPGEEGD